MFCTGKYEQQERYAEYLEELEADSSQREAMTVAMAQQEYDIRLDLNEILLTFCQTYFYEDLTECNSALKVPNMHIHYPPGNHHASHL